MSSAFKHGNLYRRLIGFFHVISLKTGIYHNIEIKTFHTAKYKYTEKVNTNQKYFKKFKNFICFFFKLMST